MALNPAGIPGCKVTEQDVYATGALFRAMANSGAPKSNQRLPFWVDSFPIFEQAGLYQTAFVARLLTTT
jgi:hypothetical protein